MQVFKNKGKDQDVSKSKLFVTALYITTVYAGSLPLTCLPRNIAFETNPIWRMHSVFDLALFSFSF
jgi:hypothetical protein